MSLSKTAQRTLRHTCYCHPKQKPVRSPLFPYPLIVPVKFFDLAEGRMVDNNSRFICHECDRANRAQFGRRMANKRQSPIENKIERALTAAKSRFICKFKLDRFEFDFAIPALNLLVEVDGRSYHRGSAQEDADEEKIPPTPGTKRHTARAAGWRLVRVRNGPRLVQRFFEKVKEAVAVVKT